MVVNGLHLVDFSAPRDLPFLAPLVQQTPWRPGPPAVTHAPSPRSTRALEQDDDTGTTSHLVPADGVTDVSKMSPKCGITPSCDWGLSWFIHIRPEFQTKYINWINKNSVSGVYEMLGVPIFRTTLRCRLARTSRRSFWSEMRPHSSLAFWISSAPPTCTVQGTARGFVSRLFPKIMTWNRMSKLGVLSTCHFPTWKWEQSFSKRSSAETFSFTL